MISSLLSRGGAPVLVRECALVLDLLDFFLSFLHWCHGRADDDGAHRNNGLPAVLLLVGGVTGAGERLVESKLLELL